ncbi:MAG: LPS-assembly protein LptD [Aquisalimonadaceae bacterium]
MKFTTLVTGTWLCCGLTLLPQTATADAEVPPLLVSERHRWAACVDGPSQLTLAPDTGLRRAPGAPTNIDADFMEFDARSSTWVLRGTVELERADQQMRADEMHYDQTNERVDASGRIRYSQTGLLLGGSRGYMELGRDRGELEAAEYLLPDFLAQGTASHVRLENGSRVYLTDATYSTCEPGDELWNLRVSRMRLDQESGIGEAWHARMNILGVPVAYVPYVNFPIDDRRKSGLLPPTLGQSTRSGTDMSIPYYWNIAPNYDATIIPRFLSQRGFMLESEFRYLLPSQSGELRTAWLPNDSEADEDRWSVAWDHRATFSRNVRGDLTLNRVSDDDYFRDFGNTLSQSSRTHLATQARVRYNTPDISSTLRAQTFQTLNPDITPGNRPYQRLPQTTFRYTPAGTDLGPLQVEPGLDAEAVRFDHPEPGLRTTGVRLDMTPRLSLPIRRQAGYIQPSMAMRLTNYALDRAGTQTGEDESLTRTTPIASLDTGLYFDRFFTAFDRPLWQTLEPRLFYLYIPRRNQDDIPVFDTGRADPSLYQLFSENRFLGADRVGDANQATLGITSRFLDRATGTEYFRAAIGQTYYFADREVTLRPGEAPESRNRSDIIGELRATLPAGLLASTELHWDPDARQSNLGGARLSWQPDVASIVTAGYRLRRINGEREIEQGDFAAVWPLGKRWHAFGGWRYALNEERTLESFGGLEYRDCCWAVRLINRYYREDRLEEAERSIMLQFEFRGLGNFGDDIGSFLEETVFGYQGTR